MKESQPQVRKFESYQWVGKTGGTTGASFETINNGVLGQIARGEFPSPRILVPSAPGKIEGDPTSQKLTEHAILAKTAYDSGDRKAFRQHYGAIRERFLDIVNQAGLNIRKWKRSLSQYEATFEYHVAHQGLLEVIQGRILSEIIPNAHFVSPDDVVETDQYGRILESTRVRTRNYLEQFQNRELTLIVPSHNARERRGHMVMLTRNCGDAVGANMARAAKMPYIIFGSTDGIFTIDPSRYENVKARKRSLLSFTELHTATQGGAYVVHVEGIVPIEQMEDGHLEVRHFRNPNKGGTVILRARTDEKPGEPPRLIAGEVGNRSLNFVRRGGVPEDDFGQRVTSSLRELDIPVKRLTADGQGAVAIIEDQREFTKEVRTSLKKQTGADSVEADTGVGMITVVGTGFLRHSSALVRVGEVLRYERVPALQVNSTGRGSGLMITTRPEHFDTIIAALHRQLIEKPDDIMV